MSSSAGPHNAIKPTMLNSKLIYGLKDEVFSTMSIIGICTKAKIAPKSSTRAKTTP